MQQPDREVRITLYQPSSSSEGLIRLPCGNWVVNLLAAAQRHAVWCDVCGEMDFPVGVAQTATRRQVREGD